MNALSEKARSVAVQILEAPQDEELWNGLDDLARDADNPDEAEVVYDAVLALDVPTAVRRAVGQRYVEFLEEWYEDTTKPIRVLHQLVRHDVENNWALEKLSLLLTLSERWDELLSVYDECLAQVSDNKHTASLLEEAARVAKDFAGQSLRASDYLKRLFLLRPEDEQLCLALERRLAEQERHQDLVDVWDARLPHVDAAQKLELRVRIAERYLTHLSAAPLALRGALELTELPNGRVQGCLLLEQLAAKAGAPVDARISALEALRRLYAQEERCKDVIRVLESHKGLVDETEAKVALERLLVDWHLRNNSPEDAQSACSNWLLLSPDDDAALEQLSSLAQATGNFAALAQSLERSAAALPSGVRRMQLVLLAAKTQHHDTGDASSAVSLYSRVLLAPESTTEQQLASARALRQLLTAEVQAGQRLDVLERLWKLEPEAKAKRDVLIEAAKLAESLEDDERALRLWHQCLSNDQADPVALDAQVALLARRRRFPELLDALRARFEHGTDPETRRNDLIWVAQLHELQLNQPNEAVVVWQEIETTFGRTNDTADALANLYEQNARWADLVSLLEQVEVTEKLLPRRTLQLTLLGDVFRVRQGELASAIARYGQALELNPRHEAARDGLVALLPDEAVRKAAAETLALAYQASDEWEGTLALVETRLGANSEVPTKQDILLEAAQLAESRKVDPHLALEYLARAFELVPKVAIEEQILRLAASTNAWSAAIDGYSRALRTCSDVNRTVELLLEQGRVYEVKVEDWPHALGAYRKAIELAPENTEAACAVVRSAGHLNDWESAAWGLIENARAQASVRSELVEAFDQAAVESWPRGLAALDASVNRAGLVPQTSHDVKFQLARWFEAELADPASSIRVLTQAVDEHRQEPSLQMLVRLQRQAPSAALVSSLLKLSEVVSEPLAYLHEAAQVALEAEQDAGLARPILARCLTLAETALTSKTADGRPRNCAEVAVWCLEQLVTIATARSEHTAALDLLLRGARLPIEQTRIEEFQHRAAEIAARQLGQVERAIELCRSLLEDNPLRFETINLLASLFEQTSQYPELIALRRDELTKTKDRSRRLALRLELSRVLGVLGNRVSDQLETLHANLEEQVGHPATLDALYTLQTARGEYQSLYGLLSEQGESLGKAGHDVEAAAVYQRAGELAQHTLNDVELALEGYRASVGLAPNVVVLDALSGIHTARKEHEEAVAWLKHRLELTPQTETVERQATLVRLGESLRDASRVEEAISYLSAGLQEEPSWTQVRELLSQLHETRKEWLEFATLLGEGVAFAQDIPTKVHYLKRAAYVWWHELDDLKRAIPLLQRAYELIPDEQPLRLSLAEAQRIAGRLAPARGLLEGLLTEFGRRRTPERANVHFQLALIERAEGNLEAALEQLDAASKIQRTDPVILKTLGDVAQQNGELERAETAYRALLLLVGRKQAQGSEVGESAILFELYRIASQRQDAARAKDLLDSALQAADQDPAEAERLEEALRQAGHWDLLLSALERRLQRAETPALRESVLRAKAHVFLEQGRAEDALDILLGLLQSNPADADLLSQAEQLAIEASQTARFYDTCLTLADQLETAGNSQGACALWMLLGARAQHDGQLPKAAGYFQRAQQTGARPQVTFDALREVLETAGDAPGLTQALERYVASDPSQLDAKTLNEALFRLAEHNLCGGGDHVRGLGQLEAALERDRDYRRAANILDAAAQLVSPSAELAQLADEVALKLNDKQLLLKAALWGADHIPLERLSDAVELASQLGETQRKPFLLEKLALRARNEHDTDRLLTALTTLAEIRRAENANEDARSLLYEALKLTSGDEHLYLALQIADIDQHSLVNPKRAATILEEIQQQHKGDVRVWKPLLALYRQLGEHTKLLACLSEAEEHADGAVERRALRLERIRLTIDAGLNAEAEKALREALDDDPDNDEAALLLVTLLEQDQRNDELESLLRQLLEHAVQRRTEGPVQTYSLKLGALYEAAGDNDAAVQVYRNAHDAVRNNRGILLALLKHVNEGDEFERANLMESLLPTEPADGVEQMSLTLASLRQNQDDESGIERAYELGLKRFPQSQVLRDKLLTWYREREQFSPLAELLTNCALQETDSERMVALLLEAASLYDTQLGDAATAADVLLKGLDRSPMSLSLLEPACEYLVTAGRPEEAMTLLDSTLADDRHSDESLALVYHLRAAVRARTDEHNLEAIVDAISDLETAGTIGGSDLVEDLATLLLRQQQLAELQGQEKYEEEAVMRLSLLLPGLGQTQELLSLLQGFCSRYPENTTIKSKWAELAFDESNWTGAMAAYTELVPLLEGEAQVAAVLRLTDAASRSGNPLAAKDALEGSYKKNPAHEGLATALRDMYKAAGAHIELAQMLLQQAASTESKEVQFLLLRDAGEILVASNAAQPEAVATLERALALSPGDHRTTLALAKANTLENNVAAACIVLEEAIKTHGKRRSTELSELQYAMSQVAQNAGDLDGQMAWLDAALQTDRRNGVVASELAILAMERNDLDMATKALQLVTLLKDEGPMTRAEAYLRQAIIADQKGDPRKAVLLAKRALNADPNYEAARLFVENHAG